MQFRHQQSAQNLQNKNSYQQIKFLQIQNQKLKQELSDAKDLIKMNKIQIDVLSKNHTHDKKLIDVIYNYRQQVQNFQKKYNSLIQNYQRINSEKLVIDQLNKQLNSEQKSIQDLHKCRIKQLSQMIRNLEDKVHTCEKNHQNYDSITGFVQKNRDLMTPLQQAIQFKNKQDKWSQEIAYLKDQLNQHKKNEENLLLANGILRNKVVSLQAKLAMPNKNLGQILDKSLKRLMLYFIQTQKKMLTGDDSDSEQEDLELIAPELMSLFPQKQKNSGSDIKVPALDLLKVRNHQMKGNQKIKQQLLRRNHLSKDQKIQRLEVQLQFTRRSLTKNMIQLKSQKQRRMILQKICEQLEERNSILIKSNQMHKKKVEKVKKDYQVNKDKNASIDKIQFDEQGELNLIKKENKNKNYVNRKMREYQVNKYLQNVQTPFEYKLHLQLLAKDLNKNLKLKDLRQKKMKKIITKQQDDLNSKLKRSTSNPFLYFNERRDQIMQIQPSRESKNENNQGAHQRLEQTEYLPMGQNKIFQFNEDLDEYDDL